MAPEPEHQPADPQPPASALRFGRFRTDEEGQTSDRLLDRAVLLRQVPTAEADELQDEARFLARMHAPGLPCVHDFMRDDAGAALVMPGVHGITITAAISARAGGQAIPAIADSTACALTFIDVCKALQAAHLRCVVHGALSTDVIILGDDEHITIVGWDAARRQAAQPLTRRFCAGGAMPERTAVDDLQRDIRAVGSCLYAAITGVIPPAEASPPQDPRIPGRLLAIVRQAMASSAVSGYRTIAELRSDLVGFLAGQSPQEPEAVAPARWFRPLAACLLLALLAGGVIAAMVWQPLRNYAIWGSPLVEVDFSTPGWKPGWGSIGRWEQRDGRLVSAGERECALYFKRRLSPPVAIEYTGRFDADNAGDLSVWWCEDDPAGVRAGDNSIDWTRSWWLQAGAYDNSWCCVWQTPARLRQQVNPRIVEPGRDHRFRVEIEGNRLRMWMDGEVVLDHRDSFPIGDGIFGIYTWNPGKSFDDVRIWQQPLPAQISPLAIGDEAMRSGRLADAASSYGRIAEERRGTPLGTEALFFQGLAMHRLGSRDLARNLWQEMPDGQLRQRAECLSIDDMVADGDLEKAADRFTSMWNGRPAIRDDLRQRWQSCGETLRSARPVRRPELERWIALRDATFPDDRASAWLVAEMFGLLYRWEDTVRRFPDEHRAVYKALMALGRNRELIASSWARPHERARARCNLGDVEGALASKALDTDLRAELLCKVGRTAEATRLDPCLAQLYLGGLEDLLARNEVGDRTAFMLVALGRYEEAAKISEPAQSWAVAAALTLLGRYDEAERRTHADYDLFRLIASLAAGHSELARSLRQDIRLNPSRLSFAPWFGQIVGLALIDEALGARGALKTALERGAALSDGYGGRCALVCTAVLDPTKAEAVRDMPWRTEAGAWLCIVEALRGELSGERAAALDGWRAFAALPPVARLLEGHAPSAELEAFAAWRIKTLSQASTAP